MRPEPAEPLDVLEPFFVPTHGSEFDVLRRAAGGPVVLPERPDRHRLDHGVRELPVRSVSGPHRRTITVWRDDFDLATAARIHDTSA